MAQGVGSGKISVFVSVDGENWKNLTALVGSIYILDEGTTNLEEITPDNPIYAELVEILNKNDG